LFSSCNIFIVVRSLRDILNTVSGNRTADRSRHVASMSLFPEMEPIAEEWIMQIW